MHSTVKVIRVCIFILLAVLEGTQRVPPTCTINTSRTPVRFVNRVGQKRHVQHTDLPVHPPSLVADRQIGPFWFWPIHATRAIRKMRKGMVLFRRTLCGDGVGVGGILENG
jgi:hypothetical protein